jgi:hypothetical protein
LHISNKQNKKASIQLRVRDKKKTSSDMQMRVLSSVEAQRVTERLDKVL